MRVLNRLGGLGATKEASWFWGLSASKHAPVPRHVAATLAVSQTSRDKVAVVDDPCGNVVIKVLLPILGHDDVCAAARTLSFSGCRKVFR